MDEPATSPQHDPLIGSLRRAVEASPGDIHLRLLLGQLLLKAGSAGDAIAQAASILQLAPGNADARQLMTEAFAAPAVAVAAEPVTAEPITSSELVGPLATSVPTAAEPVSPDPAEQAAPSPEALETPTSPDPAEHAAPGPEAPETPTAPEPPASAEPDFDWSAAENDVHELAQPMFVDSAPTVAPGSSFDIERFVITLADVGGMKAVKDRLNAAFLAPLKNPELRKLYSKSLKGGLLMYGPPGCGKTFIARAIAGELGAHFLNIGLADILDPMLGNSEQNVHEAFELARREAPCVIFFDEIDALGQRRSQTRNSALRGTVNQLLTELDGVADQNEGVFVLAATNQPWDVDPALRRPGRFDRTVLVLPPDEEARESIFRYHLQHRPVEGIELQALARASAGLSGADIAYVCEVAAEHALIDSASTGVLRMIGMKDVTDALSEVTASTSSWLDSARNVVLFGDDDGTYAELKAYLKKAKRL
ncbi:ATP-binding protein [Subtercola endophyticus]|uniref:ATP-binding protein n=1 Tax=Subtercola endophyticus TaxID=2895559 RepID=UPI001E573C5C|nr:ATP-binding protein [Subtercola endophyticus]UFS60791.1 ATP-binding protein [Subtercola endophyticus]